MSAQHMLIKVEKLFTCHRSLLEFLLQLSKGGKRSATLALRESKAAKSHDNFFRLFGAEDKSISIRISIFWAKFQRLVSEAEMYDEQALMIDLKDKLS